MARKDARNVIPSLSSEARDKLAAALSWPTGKLRNGADYERAPMYFDACWQWFRALSGDDQELVLTLADVVGSSHKNSAEQMAAALPPAPRCPL